MRRLWQRVVLAGIMVGFGGPALAQPPPGSELPPTPAEQRAARRGLPPGAPQPAADALTNDQGFTILDSYDGHASRCCS